MGPSHPSWDEDTRKRINEIADGLHERFGRPPTAQEVHDFVMGDHATRVHIWNFGLPKE